LASLSAFGRLFCDGYYDERANNYYTKQGMLSRSLQYGHVDGLRQNGSGSDQ